MRRSRDSIKSQILPCGSLEYNNLSSVLKRNQKFIVVPNHCNANTGNVGSFRLSVFESNH